MITKVLIIAEKILNFSTFYNKTNFTNIHGEVVLNWWCSSKY